MSDDPQPPTESGPTVRAMRPIDLAASPPGPAAASGQTRIPKVIGGFELIGKLGQGGMGAVFQARQVTMDRLVALKVLPPALARNREYIARFQREARASARIMHPNLVQGFDAGRDPASGLWYFAMEYVPGETLRALLERGGRLDERRALAIARDIAAGLAAAHAGGLLHRDIKPDNVILTPAGAAKILDLGLARIEHDDSALTRAQQSIGTPLYMAPEQARGDGDQVGPCTDLYALGATLFHLIAGRPPFEGPTSAVILAQHLSAPAPALDQAAPGTSAATATLVARMLAKEPPQRPRSAGEVVQRIDDILAGRGAPVPRRARSAALSSVAAAPVRSAASARPPWRRPIVLLLGCAVVAAVAAAVVLASAGSRAMTAMPTTLASSVRQDGAPAPTAPPPTTGRDAASRHPPAAGAPRAPSTPAASPPVLVATAAGGTAPAAGAVRFAAHPSRRLVLWNQHNGRYADRGALAVDLVWLDGDTVVGVLSDQPMPWPPAGEASAAFPVPAQHFDRVRVTVQRWRNRGAGLAEIELVDGGVNLLRGAPARASSVLSSSYAADRVTDGDTTSTRPGTYWLAANQSGPAWIEVEVPATTR